MKDVNFAPATAGSVQYSPEVEPLEVCTVVPCTERVLVNLQLDVVGVRH